MQDLSTIAKCCKLTIEDRALSHEDERLGEVLRNHREMPIDRRIKAGFWWCYMNSEAPIPYGEMARAFPDNELIMEWRRRAAGPYADDDEVSRWGAGIVWAEFHSSGPWRSDCE